MLPILKAPTQRVKCLSFTVKWFQKEADLVHSYVLSYYRDDNSVEILQPEKGRILMRRTKLYDKFEYDFYIGAKVSLFGRVLNIIDYADQATKEHLTPYRKKAFVVVKYSIMHELGTIFTAFADSNIMVTKAMLVHFTINMARHFLGAEGRADAATSILTRQLSAGPSVGMQLIGENILEVMKCAQSKSGEKALYKIPAALEKLFESEEMRNGFYISASEELARKDRKFFFDSEHGPRVHLRLHNSTMCIIKPHAIKEGNLGRIIHEILNNGFEITALRIQYLERYNCQLLFDAYRGILEDYVEMIQELCSGVSMAFEVVAVDGTQDSHATFRELCGPIDPQIGKLMRPNCLRAKYGKSIGKNAVHCTDVPEDVDLELRYLIKILI